MEAMGSKTKPNHEVRPSTLTEQNHWKKVLCESFKNSWQAPPAG
jgi:hypothetical protein